MVGGINGGVVLLAPAGGAYEKMVLELRSPKVRRKLKESQGPEQDFLTLFYQRSLSGLHPKYNYQLHQILLNPWGERMRMGWDDICILHFSADLKPSSFWLADGIPDYNNWLRRLFEANSANRGTTSGGTKAAYDRVDEAGKEWIRVWKQAWEGLVGGLPLRIARNRMQKCLLCGDCGCIDAAHCFFRCPRVADITEKYKYACAKHRTDPMDFLTSAPRGALLEFALAHFGAIYHRFCMDPSETAIRRSDPSYTTSSSLSPSYATLPLARLPEDVPDPPPPDDAEAFDAGPAAAAQAEGTSGTARMVIGIRARAAWMVDSVELLLDDGTTREYGGSGGDDVVVPRLDWEQGEYVQFVEQFPGRGAFLGAAMHFGTSHGRRIEVNGYGSGERARRTARPARVEAAYGRAITGLKFDDSSSRLVSAICERVAQPPCCKRQRRA